MGKEFYIVCSFFVDFVGIQISFRNVYWLFANSFQPDVAGIRDIDKFLVIGESLFGDGVDNSIA